MDELIVDAILFDLDGTLVDSTTAVDTAWKELAAELGIPFAELTGRYHGIPSAVTLGGLLPGASPGRVDALAEQLLVRQASDLLAVTPARGALELLTALPSSRWAVVTSGSQRLALASIRKAVLPRPEVLITADDVSLGKPDPEPYLLAATRLGVEPARCLVVEDAPAGVASARAAGMRCLAVTTTHSAEELERADWIRPDLSRLQLLGDSSAGLRLGIS